MHWHIYEAAFNPAIREVYPTLCGRYIGYVLVLWSQRITKTFYEVVNIGTGLAECSVILFFLLFRPCSGKWDIECYRKTTGRNFESFSLCFRQKLYFVVIVLLQTQKTAKAVWTKFFSWYAKEYPVTLRCSAVTHRGHVQYYFFLT